MDDDDKEPEVKINMALDYDNFDRSLNDYDNELI